MSKTLMIVFFGALMVSVSAMAVDANCPADLPLSKIDFLNNDVKFVVINPIPIDKFESSKVWDFQSGDIKIHTNLSLQESKTKKRVLPKNREIYAISMTEYAYGSNYEAQITFDDPAVSSVSVTHEDTSGGTAPVATVRTLERSLGDTIQILCPTATVDPTLR